MLIKILTTILLLVAIITICVFASVYVIDLKINADESRYRIVFGEIDHTMSEPHPEEEGLVQQIQNIQKVCLKLDTKTGEVWRYESDFYDGPDKSVQTKGFMKIRYGFLAHVERKKQKDKAIRLDEIKDSQDSQQQPRLILDDN